MKRKNKIETILSLGLSSKSTEKRLIELESKIFLEQGILDEKYAHGHIDTTEYFLREKELYEGIQPHEYLAKIKQAKQKRIEHHHTFLAFLFLVIMMGGAFFSLQSPTGLVTFRQTDTTTLSLNETIEGNGTILLNISNVTSLQITGMFEGNEISIIAIGDREYTVYESGINNRNQRSKTPNLITGRVIDENITNLTEELVEDVEETSVQNETNQTETTEFQEEIIERNTLNRTINQTNSSESSPINSLNITNETNLTTTNSTNVTVEPPINITNNTNQTNTTNETKPLTNETEELINTTINETNKNNTINQTLNITTDTNQTEEENQTNTTNETEPVIEVPVINETNKTNQTIILTFDNACKETCLLNEIEISAIKIVSDGKVKISTITYSTPKNIPINQIREVPNFNGSLNETIQINAFEYFEGASIISITNNEGYNYTEENESILVKPNKEGIFSAKLQATNGIDFLESNEFLIIVGTINETNNSNQTNLTELIITQEPAIIGQPVTWKVKGPSDKVRNFKLPENARVQNEKALPAAERLEKTDIEEIIYQTPAPISTINSKGNGQYFQNIYAKDNVTNVTSYLDVEEGITEQGVRIFWNEEKKLIDNFWLEDTNLNGLNDRVYYIVPHLSNQTFDINLTILTLQSYPYVGEYWEVEFTTVGTADLKIEGGFDTFFNGDDLTHIELRCGSTLLTITELSNGVIYEDFNCNESGFHKVQVHTLGKHVQKFTFGNISLTANNSAIDYDSGNLTAFEIVGIPDNPFNSSLSEATAGEYANISTLNNVRWNTSLAGNSEYDSQVFIFNLSKTDYTSLKLIWDGYGETDSGLLTNISFWNWTSQSWVNVHSQDHLSSNDYYTIVTATQTENDYINTSTMQVAVLISTLKGTESTVILNEATGTSCDTVCSGSSLTCTSIGTNIAGNNGYYTDGSGGRIPQCFGDVSGSCSSVMSNTGSDICGDGKNDDWTYCLCEPASPFLFTGENNWEKQSDFLANKIGKENKGTTYQNLELQEGKVRIGQIVNEIAYIDQVAILQGDKVILPIQIFDETTDKLQRLDDNFVELGADSYILVDAEESIIDYEVIQQESIFEKESDKFSLLFLLVIILIPIIGYQKKLRKVTSKFEGKSSIGLSILSILSIIVIRTALENYFVGIQQLFTPIIWAELILFWVPLAIIFTLFQNLILKESLQETLHRTSFIWLITLIPPIIDTLFRVQHMSYLVPGTHSLIYHYTSFLDAFNIFAPFTVGIKIEILLVMIFASSLFFNKEKKLWGIISPLLVYTIIFLSFTTPHILSALGILNYSIVNQQMVGLHLIIISILLVTCTIIYRKQLRYNFTKPKLVIKELFRNNKQYRLVNYWCLFLLGNSIGYASSGELNILRIVFGLIAIYFGWKSAIYLNDAYDIKEDKLNKVRTPALTDLGIRNSVSIALGFGILSILFSILTGMLSGPWIILFLVLYTAIYSCRPYRFKRNIFIPNLIIGLCSTTVLIAGVAITIKEKTLQIIPKEILLTILITYTFLSAIKDFKDTFGDKKAKVRTITTYLGHKNSKRILGLIALIVLFFVGSFIKINIILLLTVLLIFLYGLVKEKEKAIFVSSYLLILLIAAFAISGHINIEEYTPIEKVKIPNIEGYKLVKLSEENKISGKSIIFNDLKSKVKINRISGIKSSTNISLITSNDEKYLKLDKGNYQVLDFGNISGNITLQTSGYYEKINHNTLYTDYISLEPGYLSGNIVSCGDTISSNGNYFIGSQTIDTADCLDIIADDVVIDCNGAIIQGHNLNYNGIDISADNVTVQNCYINDFGIGINILGNVNIINTTINSSNDAGFYISNTNLLVNNLTIINPTLYSWSAAGSVNLTINNSNITAGVEHSFSNTGVLDSLHLENTYIDRSGAITTQNSLLTIINSTILTILGNESLRIHGDNYYIRNSIFWSNGNNGIGIYYGNGTITGNTFANTNIAIRFDPYENSVVSANISNNNITGIQGFYLNSSRGTIQNSHIYGNTINTTYTVNSTETSINYWNNSQGGNYWYTPSGSGFSQTCSDENLNGICDNSYEISTNNEDQAAHTNIKCSNMGGDLALPISLDCRNEVLDVGDLTIGPGTIINLTNTTLVVNALIVEGELNFFNSKNTLVLNDWLNISGNTTLNYTNVKVNISQNKQFGIAVKSGGLLKVVNDTNITLGNTSGVNYQFFVEGTGRIIMNHSEADHIGSSGAPTESQGLFLNSNNNIIQNSVLDGGYRVLLIGSSYNNITNVTLVDSDGANYRLYGSLGANYNILKEIYLPPASGAGALISHSNNLYEGISSEDSFYLRQDSDNNIFIDSSFTHPSSGDGFGSLQDGTYSSDNNYILRGNATSQAGYAIELLDGDNYTFQDFLVDGGDFAGDYDVVMDGDIGTVYFINTTFVEDTYLINAGTMVVQQYVTIRVIDGFSNPIDSATIELYDATGNNTHTATTNSEGYVVKLNVTKLNRTSGGVTYASNYTLNISKAGYQNYSYEFNLTDNMNFSVTLNSPPTVILLNPDDGILTSNTTIYHQCEAYDTDSLFNISLYSNTTGTWQLNKTWDTRTLSEDQNTVFLTRFNGNLLSEEFESPTTSTGITFDSGRYYQAAVIGSGDSLQYYADNNLELTQGTIEMWIYPTIDFDTSSSLQVLFAAYNSSGQSFEWYVDDTGGTTEIYWSNSDATVELDTDSNASDWNANQWYHLALTWDFVNDEYRMYRDGVLVGHQDVSLFEPNNATYMHIGEYWEGSYDLMARIAEIKISDKVLSWSEINNSLNTSKNNVTANFTISTYEFGSSEWTCQAQDSYEYSAFAPTNRTISVQATCNPGSVWFIENSLTCNNKNITVDQLNITGGGTLTLYNTNLTVNGRSDIEGTFNYLNSKNSMWQDGNLTITGTFNIVNSTLRMNSTYTNHIGINVSGTINVNESSNITNGVNTSARYFFIVNKESSASLKNSYIYQIGDETLSNQFSGIYFDTPTNITNVEFTKVTGLLFTDYANNSNLSNSRIINYYDKGINSTASYLLIQNVNMTDHISSEINEYAILIRYANNVTINNLNISNITNTQNVGLAYGMQLSYLNDSTINNTVIDYVGGVGAVGVSLGIYLLYSDRNIIENTNITRLIGTAGPSSAGINLVGSSNNSFNNIFLNELNASLNVLGLTTSSGSRRNNFTEINSTESNNIYISSDNNLLNEVYVSHSANTEGIEFGIDADLNYLTNFEIYTSGTAGAEGLATTVGTSTFSNYAINGTIIASGMSNDLKANSIGFLNLTNVTFEGITSTTGNATVYKMWYYDITVTNQLDQGIDGATVKFTDQSGGIRYLATVDSNGVIQNIEIPEFIFNRTDSINNNNYTLSINKTGFDNFSQEINISSNLVETKKLEEATNTCYPDSRANWKINESLTCSDLTIRAYKWNVTSTGNLTLNNVNVIINDISVIQGNVSITDSKETIWINDYLNITGDFYISNSTIRANGSSNGDIRINVSSGGYFQANESSNITRGNASANYEFTVFGWINFTNTNVSYAGYNSQLLTEGLYLANTSYYNGGTIINYVGIIFDESSAGSSIQNILFDGSNIGYTGIYGNSVGSLYLNDLNFTSIEITPSFSSFGIYLADADNSVLSNIFMYDNDLPGGGEDFNGIILSSTDSLNITNFTLQSNDPDYLKGIYLSNSNNNRIINYLINESTSSQEGITNFGISIESSDNNYFQDITIYEYGGSHIVLGNSQNNEFYNLELQDSNNDHLIYGTSTVTGNSFTNINITNSTDISLDGNNNIFTNLRIQDSNMTYLSANNIVLDSFYINNSGPIRIDGTANITLKNGIIGNTTDSEIVMGEIGCDGGQIKAYNVTFDRYNISYTTGDCSIELFHYVRVYVNDTDGSVVDLANVYVYNNQSNLLNSDTTDETGYTSYFNVSDFYENSTDKFFYNNYRLNTTVVGKGTDEEYYNISSTGDYYLTVPANVFPRFGWNITVGSSNRGEEIGYITYDTDFPLYDGIVAGTTIWTGNSKTPSNWFHRAFLDFNASNIDPNASITGVQLGLARSSSVGYNIDIVDRDNDWGSYALNSTVYNDLGSNAYSSSVSDWVTSAQNEFVYVTVGGNVAQDFETQLTNNQFLIGIRGSTEASDTRILFHSDEASLDLKPKLNISYIIKNFTWDYNTNISPIDLNLYFYDKDGEGTLTYNLNGSTNITLVVNATNDRAIFVPDTNFTGTETVNITAIDDKGVYVTSNNFTLTVTSNPEIESIGFSESTAYTNTSLNLTYEVSGVNSIISNVTWYVDGTPVLHNNSQPVIEGEAYTTKLFNNYTNNGDNITAGLTIYNIWNTTYYNITIKIQNYSTTLDITNSSSEAIISEEFFIYANYSINNGYKIDGVRQEIGTTVWNKSFDVEVISTETFDCGQTGNKECIVIGLNSSSGHDLRMFYSNGTSIYSREIGWAVEDIHTYDYDKDGFENDFAFVGADTLRIYNQTGQANATSLNATADNAIVLITADFDGDTNEDIVIGTTTGDIGVFNETFEDLYKSNYQSTRMNELEKADLNGDGYEDIIAMEYSSNLYAINGTNGNTLWQKNTIGGVALAVLDLDNDGVKDEIAVGVGDNDIIFYDETGGELFTLDLSGVNGIRDIFVADLDGDGYEDDIFTNEDTRDVAVACTSSSCTRIWNGTAESCGRNNMLGGDFNDDGLLDLIGGTTCLNLYDNDGTFIQTYDQNSAISSNPFSYGDHAAVSTGDIDGDGITDIIFGNANSELYVVREVSCTADFNDSTSYNMTWNYSTLKWDLGKTFLEQGIVTYNITCEKGGYDYQQFSGELFINGTAPIIQTARITPTSPKVNDELIGYCNATNGLGTNVTYYYIWYQNDEINSSGVTSNNFTEGIETNVDNISQELTVGDAWILSCRAYDGSTNSTWLNSSATSPVSELDPPIISWIAATPNDAEVTDNTSIVLNTSISDLSNYSAFFDWNKSLKLYLSMDYRNSTRVADNSTYGHHAEYKSSVDQNDNASGVYGQAYNDPGGDGDRLSVETNSDLVGFANITVAFWVKFDSFTGTGDSYKFLVAKSGYSSSREWRFRWEEPNSNIIWQVSGDGEDPGASETQIPESSLTAGTWHYLVGTWTNTTGQLEFYLDGSRIDTNTYAAAAIYPSGTSNITIGGSSNNGAGSGVDDFGGDIDEVKVWDRVLTPEEINASMNQSYRLINNFTGLGEGTYNYSAYAIDYYGNMQITNSRSVQVLFETTPSIENVTSSPGTIGYGYPVNVTANISDQNGLSEVYVELTEPGKSPKNHTMFDSENTGYWKNFTFWSNGTYNYRIIAVSTSSGFNTSSNNFNYTVNAQAQIKTLKDNYVQNQQVNLTDPPGGSNPSIISVSVDPYKVRPGDILRIDAEVIDDNIKEVFVDVKHELGYDRLTMNNGDNNYSNYTVNWIVHNTLEKEYWVEVNAVDHDGNIEQKRAYYFDPVASWCFQETANISTSCGGLDTGEYAYTGVTEANFNLAVDEDYGTFPIDSAYTFYSNYTIPSNTQNGSRIQVKHGVSSLDNYTLPWACLNKETLEIQIIAYYGCSGYCNDLTINCYDSSSWSELDLIFDTTRLYEEAIYWNITQEITYSEFDGLGDSTDLSSLEDGDNITNLVLDDQTNGKITWEGNVSLNNSMNLDTAVEISSSYIFVNSTLYEVLNKSANITVYGKYSDLNIYKDGVLCTNCVVLNSDPDNNEITFNISSFSNYTWSEKNQSKINNTGSTDFYAYIYLAVEYWNSTSSQWILDGVVYSDSSPQVINSNDLLKLDSLFNGLWNTSANSSYGSGTYRVKVEARDNETNVLQNSTGGYLNATYNFTFTNNSAPSISATSLTPTTAYNNTDLLLYATCDDSDVSDTLTAEFEYYSDEALQSGLSNSGSATNGISTLIDTLDDSNTKVGEEWSARVRCYDEITYSDWLWISTNVTIQNSAPITPEVYINSTFGNNATTDDLNCYAYVGDVDDEETNVSIKWYLNGTLNYTEYFNNSYANNTLVYSTLGSSNTSAGDNWSCAMQLNDTMLLGSWGNSTNLTVLGINEIYSCTDITTPGSYVLGLSITEINEDYCINITANNVDLDCGGNWLNTTGSANDYGIFINSTSLTDRNITINDCKFHDFNEATIYIENGYNVNITNSFDYLSTDELTTGSEGSVFAKNSHNIVINNYTGQQTGGIILINVNNTLVNNTNLTTIQANNYLQNTINTTFNNSYIYNSYGVLLYEQHTLIRFINAINTKVHNTYADNSEASFYPDGTSCSTEFNNVTNNRNAEYVFYNTSTTLEDGEYAQIIFCGFSDGIINNITINGSDSFEDRGTAILLQNVSNVIIDNSSVLNKSDVIVLETANNVSIKNSQILDTVEGYLVSMSSDSLGFFVDNSTFDSDENILIRLASGTDNISITNSRFYYETYPAIQLYGSKANITYSNFTGEYVSNSDGIITYSSTSTGIIANNYLHSTGLDFGAGILISGDYTIVENNTLNLTTLYGISISSSEYSEIRHNTIVGSTYAFRSQPGSAGNYVYNNFINTTATTYSISSNNESYNTTLSRNQRIYGSGAHIGGNFWATPSGTGFSQTCTDTDTDGFCDNEFDVNDSGYDILPLSTAFSNEVPSITNVNITPLDNVFTDQDLYLNATCNEGDNNSLKIVYYEVYADGINQTSLAGSSTVLNDTNTLIATIDNSQTSALQNWSARFRCEDGTTSTGWTWVDRNVTIQNTIPGIPDLSRPLNDTNIYQRKPFFNWTNVTDLDVTEGIQSISFHFNLTNPSGTCYTLYTTGIISLNYTPVSNLCINDDLTKNYTWQVRSFDGYNYSDWSDPFNFSIDSLLDIRLIDNSSDLGDVDRTNTTNTTVTNDPLEVRNDGNIPVNLSIVADNGLWDSVSLNTTYFRYNATDNETDSFNHTLTPGEWKNITGNQTLLAAVFDWENSSDQVFIHFEATAPLDEPPGEKIATLNITAVYTDE